MGYNFKLDSEIEGWFQRLSMVWYNNLFVQYMLAILVSKKT